MLQHFPGRNAHVDFLRGIAILCVLLLHFCIAYGVKNCPLGLVLSHDQLRALFFHGNFGVTVFFVISGYLITSMSVARWGSLDRIDPLAFYLYRFARIMPSLLLVLAIVVALGCLDLPYFSNSDDGKHLPASYFLIAVGSVLSFWHNVLMQSVGYFNYCLNVLWSLSVEEVFYLALPLVCLGLRRTGWIVAVCVGLIIYAPIYRNQHADNELFFMYGYLACFDAIALGCLTALLAQRWPLTGRPARALRLVAGGAFCLLYLRGIGGHEAFGFSLIALCAAAYLLGAVNDTGASWATGQATRPLRWLGRHSYELYLFHVVVLGLMRNLLDRDQLNQATWLVWLALFLALSALAAQLVARLVSEPANAAIRRLYLQRRLGGELASVNPQ